MQRSALIATMQAVAYLVVVTVSLFIGLDAFGQKNDPAVKKGSESGNEIPEEKGEGEDINPDKNKLFGFDTGLNGSYATGLSDSSLYWQLFINLHLKHRFVKFTAGISRLWGYQINNGNGDSETVNFTQPRLALSLYPLELLEIYGEYRFSGGDSSHYYRTHEGRAGFNIITDRVGFDISLSKKKSEFQFKTDDAENLYSIYSAYRDRFPSMNINRILFYTWDAAEDIKIQKSDDLSVSPLLSIYINNTISLDFGYQYHQNNFQYLAAPDIVIDNYYIHRGRAGVFVEPWKHLDLIAGLSFGGDSEDYAIVGYELGFLVKLFKYVKLTLLYTPEYYIAPDVDFTNLIILNIITTVSSFSKRPNSNPHIHLSQIGKDFWNHGITFGATFTY